MKIIGEAFSLVRKCWRIVIVFVFAMFFQEWLRYVLGLTQVTVYTATVWVHFCIWAIVTTILSVYLEMGCLSYLIENYEGRVANKSVFIKGANNMFFKGLIGTTIMVSPLLLFAIIGILFAVAIPAVSNLPRSLKLLCLVPIVGIFAIILVGWFWLLLKVSLWKIAMFCERIAPVSAMKRSYNMTRGTVLRIIMFMYLPYGIAAMISKMKAFLGVFGEVLQWCFVPVFVPAAALLIYHSIQAKTLSQGDPSPII